jgi:hypothetical protein
VCADRHIRINGWIASMIHATRSMTWKQTWALALFAMALAGFVAGVLK